MGRRGKKKQQAPEIRQATFKFRRGVTVGSVVAETDGTFLADAFLDTGHLSVLRDTANPKSVVVGRTGAGKSALLLKLEETEERAIRIRPGNLSLRYLNNSTIIPYLTKIGVRLDPFYQLLWRHVFVMELIRRHYGLDDEGAATNFLQRISTFVARNTSAKKRRALDYFKNWNPRFWCESDIRVKEITDRLKESVSAEMGGELDLGIAQITGKVNAEVASDKTVSQEIVARAQRVVDKVSLRAIEDGLDIVREDVLGDAQKRYYVIIDDLDKNWIEIDYAYDLIDALLDVVADFAAIPRVKIVVALRTNIIEALHSRREKQRQQREKHKNLFMEVRWTPKQLVDMMDERLIKHVRGSYGGDLDLAHVLPPPRGKQQISTVDYMLRRTFNRPRDLIDFVNECLAIAADRDVKQVSWKVLGDAEMRYSTTRLRALADEWYDNHAGIEEAVQTLRGLPPTFTVGGLDANRLQALISDGKQMHDAGKSDPTSIPLMCYLLASRDLDFDHIWLALVPILFQVSAIGIKPGPESKVQFADELPVFPTELLTREVQLSVHPALYRGLQIKDVDFDAGRAGET
jgi:hypothetical protein